MARVCPECGRTFDNDVGRCSEDGTATYLVGQDDDLVGTVVDGRFTVKSLLGKGGMGAVYRAAQHSMGRDVALKVLRRDMAADEQAVKRFLREARAASRLTGPHTITVFDFGQTGQGLLYIAMELLQGRSLARILKDEPGPMDPVRAVRIVDQVLDSLVEAHDAGVLHRDLKPDNIFVLEGAGRQDFVKVLDFGIAKLQDPGVSSLTGTGMAFGTPAYMSPEQAQAEDVDRRSDLYSIGVVLFELLSGKLPFDGVTPLAIMVSKVTGPPPSIVHVNPDVRIPAALETLLSRLLANKPEDRPADATEVKAALAEVFDGKGGPDVPMTGVVVRGGVTVRAPGYPRPAGTMRRPRGKAKWAFLAFVPILAGGAVFLATSGDAPGPEAPAAAVPAGMVEDASQRPDPGSAPMAPTPTPPPPAVVEAKPADAKPAEVVKPADLPAPPPKKVAPLFKLKKGGDVPIPLKRGGQP